MRITFSEDSALAAAFGMVAQIVKETSDDSEKTRLFNILIGCHNDFAETLKAAGFDLGARDQILDFIIREARRAQN
ncbi:hypothetical protein Hden_1557 [Hyphomicrobium denitrificans ATCC 51888]|uniref:Uncharacterized protein n=1 Tax=Hyphomicrobium denitrificans (strain ATCC 51888 / DSM 1869 / NCIMB 11706 / TK 0415) TaxID=582899 RepID=D8JQ43_HYPDA|nr:hypothetical protein [Hyphomicrobium denitrificans]ADJ21964.1 hypothetical protein Hden_0137 [Hyphomicrobium denitrificans ATCC 51888]ADJ23369.1 hypothetical protein Hden_1557 [Hyphomicrobium denitrificans ATCC 51888]